MNILKNLPDSYSKVTYLLICLAVGSIPFTRVLMLPIFILLALVWLFFHPWKATISYYTQRKLWPALILFCSLFLLTLIGTIYSQNVGHAFPDWECKLWFLGAPLFLFPMLRYLTKKEWVILIFIFCLSTLLVTISNIVWSTAILSQTGDISQFFYTKASHFFGSKATHPSYLSMYTCFSWLACIVLLKNKMVENKTIKVLFYISLVLFPLEIMRLQSKAGMLAWGVIALLLLVVYINQERKRPCVTVLAAVALVAVMGALATAPVVSKRLNESVEALQEGDASNPSNGTMQRVVIWKTALQLSRENLPFGVGTGDVKDTLQKAYMDNGYTRMYTRQLNCHNQYLQTALGLGILGIISLLFWLVNPFVLAIRNKNVLLIGLILLIALNMLVESMLETRAGSNFIPLMVMVLWLMEMTTPNEVDLA